MRATASRGQGEKVQRDARSSSGVIRAIIFAGRVSIGTIRPTVHIYMLYIYIILRFIMHGARPECSKRRRPMSQAHPAAAEAAPCPHRILDILPPLQTTSYQPSQA